MAAKFKNGVETNTLKVTTSPVAGSVLTSDSSGNATWQAQPAITTYLIDGGTPTSPDWVAATLNGDVLLVSFGGPS